MNNVPGIQEMVLRLAIVITIGGLIGVERELKTEAAGFRTIMLICLGSFLFTTFSIALSPNTPDRIASNIVTGIGFLGAGVIFRGQNKVSGLTTAATIWVTAALGMGVAMGYYKLVLMGAALVMGLLFLLVPLKRWIDRINQYRTYKITTVYHAHILLRFEDLLRSYHLHFRRDIQYKEGENIIISWVVRGKEKDHELFIQHILQLEEVQRFEF
jgi:putative Mg2+ transporter-C (MgtC) family protein